MPGMPSTPFAVEIGASLESILRRRPIGGTAYSCQPSVPSTISPTLQSGCSDATIWPTPPAVIVSPIWMFGA